MTSNNSSSKGHVIDKKGLPIDFPTHAHEPFFWENLGRTVASFGFLEEVLSKAIFAFTATRRYPEDDVQKAYDNWLPLLERSMSDPLGNLIDTYCKSVKNHSDANISNFSDLEEDLRAASKIRNVLCHGSWRPPNSYGASVPFFINRQKEKFEDAVDANYLKKVQAHVTELSCEVINSVTHMGWQFPGSDGPGKAIWD